MTVTRLKVMWVLVLVAVAGQTAAADDSIQSEVLTTGAGELILAQEVVIEAPVSAVWKAYTTSAGWMAWAAPLVEMELRAGGTIRTHYGEGAQIGDPGTNVLHIVNYVPERVLTLRAEMSERWPEVMKEDAGNLMNVVVFETMGESKPGVSSYGVVYGDLPAYDDLMQFFIPANEGLLGKLKKHLENQAE